MTLKNIFAKIIIFADWNLIGSYIYSFKQENGFENWEKGGSQKMNIEENVENT